jgi:hypothetical protein
MRPFCSIVVHDGLHRSRNFGLDRISRFRVTCPTNTQIAGIQRIQPLLGLRDDLIGWQRVAVIVGLVRHCVIEDLAQAINVDVFVYVRGKALGINHHSAELTISSQRNVNADNPISNSIGRDNQQPIRGLRLDPSNRVSAFILLVASIRYESFQPNRVIISAYLHATRSIRLLISFLLPRTSLPPSTAHT